MVAGWLGGVMVKKWIAPMKRKMKRAGTVGSLRAIAQRRGLLAGKGDSLTCSDIAKLKKSSDPKIVKKATAAGNMMKCK